MQNRRQFLTFFAATASIVAITGCNSGGQSANSGAADNSATAGASPAASASAQNALGPSEVSKVTVGYLPNIVIPQPLIGLQEGVFAKQVGGVTFAGKDYPAGPAVMEALRAGVIDVAYTGPYPPLKAFVKDKDMVLLAAAGSGGTELSVSKNSPIKSVKDLKGKAVGVNQLGSTVSALVEYNILQAGLKPNVDVKIIEIKPAEQADALARNEVAAVAAPAPWPSVTSLKGARPLLDWKQIMDGGKYLQGVLFTTKKFAAANPNFVRSFVSAHRQITDDLNTDRTKGDARVLKAWEAVSKKTLKPEVAKAAFATIEYVNDSSVEEWNRMQDIAVETGIMRKKGALDGFLYTP